MIKDKKICEKFEQDLIKSNAQNFLRNLEDIEYIINIAKVVNSV